ncbi:response regulator [Leuconostoc citreum]|uniref:response regulator n=1 Tax=Leuconostoc citreum TaxID=33964 RepID=UPI0032DFB5F0
MQKVYIIEDDEGITQQMRQALEKWHFAVSSVADFEAIDTEVRQCQPNIIVMDITLPYFDGFFWTQKIRTFSQVPIIFCFCS